MHHPTLYSITGVKGLLRRNIDVRAWRRALLELGGHPLEEVSETAIGSALAFSFNAVQGICPECSGLGRKIGVDLEAFLDTSKSLNQGAILFPEYAVDSWGWNFLTQSRLFNNDKKLADYTDAEIEFMNALDDYKRSSGRMFPTCSEILEVVRGLGMVPGRCPPKHYLCLDRPIWAFAP